ncbi:unnamed protein product [Vitrella brassicaformis CCMP3155]|uniref:F-box domain-containing protein n=1 Tax=Vitrella brassicaformis (strain CCMP3155) TaxID=1169540 RepID=A0A0G4EQ22_VITBC|nr:unnamed protein product [Vitrella brassicaformis CCMP3155]|eukprot:CEL99386.1 unnamed protein product [Vitrella brassicaformis CCMP3155]
MSWLLPKRRHRSYSYRRVAVGDPSSISQHLLSVVATHDTADHQGLPADVLARVFASFLTVDDALRARAVGKAYGTQLIDEAFLLRRINSSLAQQQLPGLLDVERDRGVDPSAPPLPSSLSRFGYLARCAYVIERAAEWRHMATFIRVAGACGVAGQLPVLLSAESVAAHVPDMATLHRLPAAMTVYKIFGGLVGCGLQSISPPLQLTEGDQEDTDLWVLPANLLGRVPPRALENIYLLVCGCGVVGIPLALYYFLVAKAQDAEWRGLGWFLLCMLAYCLEPIFVSAACHRGWAVASLIYRRTRLVQWYQIGVRRLRVIDGDELWRLRPFIRPIYRPTDPPISCSTSHRPVYPSFSAFALDTLLQFDEVSSRMTEVLDVDVLIGGPARYGALSASWIDGSDISVIDWQEDWQEDMMGVRSGIVVLLLGGASVVAAVSVVRGRIVIRTTEVEVGGEVTVDERFPVTVAAVRQLLRRYGLEDKAFGPSS